MPGALYLFDPPIFLLFIIYLFLSFGLRKKKKGVSLRLFFNITYTSTHPLAELSTTESLWQERLISVIQRFLNFPRGYAGWPRTSISSYSVYPFALRVLTKDLPC